MSSATLQDIIKKLPNESGAIERLSRVFATSEDDDEFTAERLYEHVDASSVEATIKILRELTIAHLVEPRFTVEAPSGVGLGPFKSIADIPDELRDPYSSPSMVFQVQPEDIRVYYRRHSATK